MKSLFSTLLLVLFFISSLSAQGGNNLESIKIAFITERLELSPKEAQSFWPLYNQYKKETHKVEVEMRANRDNIIKMSDAEVSAMVERRLFLEEKKVQLEREFLADLKKVLPIRKVALLPKVEDEFRTMVLKLIKEKRRQRRSSN